MWTHRWELTVIIVDHDNSRHRIELYVGIADKRKTGKELLHDFGVLIISDGYRHTALCVGGTEGKLLCSGGKVSSCCM